MIRKFEKPRQFYVLPGFPDNRADEVCRRYEISASARHPKEVHLMACCAFNRFGLCEVDDKVRFYADLVKKSERQCSIADANALAVATDSERPSSSEHPTETSYLLDKTPANYEDSITTVGSDLALW